MLPAYYNHFRSFENTLVTKFYGLHCVKLAGANQKKVRMCVHKKIYLLLPTLLIMHETSKRLIHQISKFFRIFGIGSGSVRYNGEPLLYRLCHSSSL